MPRQGDPEAKRFWDERARENALYFVDNRLDYRDPDEARFWAGGEEDLDVLLTAAGVHLCRDDRVVEIGCGVGRLTRAIAARVADVRAVDVSPEMLQRARAHNDGLANVTWMEGDGASLVGIDDASASAVISHVVFQHIPDPRVVLAYVREIGRVLAQQGWAAFQISNDPGIHRARGSRMRRRLGRSGVSDDPHWWGSAVELDELRVAAAEGGMAVEAVTGAGTQFCIVRTRRSAA